METLTDRDGTMAGDDGRMIQPGPSFEDLVESFCAGQAEMRARLARPPHTLRVPHGDCNGNGVTDENGGDAMDRNEVAARLAEAGGHLDPLDEHVSDPRAHRSHR